MKEFFSLARARGFGEVELSERLAFFGAFGGVT
jgi:hypothetical protein